MPSKYLFVVLLSLFCTHTFAQTNDTRPKLYAAYPSTIAIDAISLDKLLSNKQGTLVSIPFTEEFTFEGIVFSNITKYNAMHTVMLRSVQNPQSVLQVTKIENKEKMVSYSGRLLNNNAADGYLIKNNNGEYFLQKFETAKILETCK